LSTRRRRSRRRAPVSRRDRSLPGKYNLCLGAAFDGSRLDKPHREDVGHDQIVAALPPLIERYALECDASPRFGDFVIRKGYVAPTIAGRDFHANVNSELAA
jgi:sulfite reductase (NADPH) hemoprotein beta-component